MLDNIGIIFKAKDAYTWFKETFPNEDFDRVTAWKRFATEQIVDKAEKIQVKGKVKQRLERLNAKLRDGTAKIGRRVMQQC